MKDTVKEALIAEIAKAMDAWCFDDDGNENCALEVEGRKWTVKTPFSTENLIEVECEDLHGQEGLRIFTIAVNEVKG